jgi:UPF0716 protein FxsA
MPLLLLLLLVVPIAELYVIVQVGQEIGVLPTILLLVAVSLTGAYLLKREGLATWRRFQTQMSEGRMPTSEAADGALILFGGALLLTPGFLTDIVGLVFILPATRGAVKGGFRKLAGGWAIKRMGPAGYVGGKIYDTQVTKRRKKNEPPRLDQP